MEDRTDITGQFEPRKRGKGKKNSGGKTPREKGCGAKKKKKKGKSPVQQNG